MSTTGQPEPIRAVAADSGAARDAGGWIGDVPMAMAATTADGRIVAWDAVAQLVLGYRADEAVGRHISEVLHPGVHRGMTRALWERAATGQGIMGAVTARHRDGSFVQLEIWARPCTGAAVGADVVVFAAEARSTARVRGASAVWDGLFARSPIGIGIFDTHLRFVRVNPALQAMNGLAEADHVGRTLPEVLPAVNAHAMEEHMRTVLATGTPVLDFRRIGRTAADPGTDRVWSCSWVRLEDGQGTPVGITACLVDITAQEEARAEAEAGRQRLAMLAEASTRIGTTLDLERTAQELAAFAVPGLADTVTVDLLEAFDGGGDLVSGLFGGATLRRAGKAPAAGSPVADVLGAVGDRFVFPAAAPYTQAFARRRPFVVTDLDETAAGVAAPFSSVVRNLRARGVTTLMMVPLVARGLVLGVATFYRSSDGPFDESDVALAGELAARAAVCVDNARLYAMEHDTALVLQRSMLPQHVTPPPGIEIAHRYIAASDVNEVGGDWYDVVPLPDGRAALLIGDVMGHGIAAAAVMGRLSSTVRAVARLGLPPVQVLQQLETALADLAEPMLATFLYAECDPVTGRCLVTRAGHPPPAVVTPDGRVHLPEMPAGAPLGIGGVPFTTTELRLEPGSLLVLYTDGLVEARGRDIDERLAELLHVLGGRPPESLHGVCEQLIGRMVPSGAEDDVALLVARIGGAAYGPGGPPG
ncbi:SpoIIE family protein phosphatase [Kitasatospora sp. NBC_01539]|uniref:SpoIIE family protein phosphatase n=1 Tax=Kitasatospora sp. NBC_01539 TaxID=2903577 RepID=UPI0038603157